MAAASPVDSFLTAPAATVYSAAHDNDARTAGATSGNAASRAMPDYDPAAVEARWQQHWQQQRTFHTAPPADSRTPAYVFAGCPFTSGDAHMGHIRSYTISDAFARFLRARGNAVLFSLGFDSFGLPAELEAVRRGISPREWVARCAERMRGQFERLGYSCDWERTFDSSLPDHYRWTQWLFLAMRERDLVYESTSQVSWCDSCQTVLAALQSEDGTCWRCHQPVRFRRLPQWFMRISAYVEDNEQGLEKLPGWSKAAIGSQRAVIGRVDGVELDATTLDGVELTVFTPHAEHIAQAQFIVLSPAHAQVDRWTAEPRVARELEGMREAGWRRDDRELEQVPVVATGALASVPGVEGMLPILISPLVDARYGPTAALGVPAQDATDAAIAQRLTGSGAGRGGGGAGRDGGGTGRGGGGAATGMRAWKVTGKGAKAAPRPAVRYRARDFAISRQRAWGAPIPLIHCGKCGTVPVPYEDLPVRLPEDLQITGTGNPLDARPDFTNCQCPSCGGEARRETDTIDCHVDGMWMWMPICVPAADRPEHMFDHPEYRRWLPARQIVWGADAGGYMFDQRLIGKVLQDLDELPPVPGREPFANALMHQMIRLDGRKMSKHLGNVVDPNELVEHVGADTVRLAVLQAASPGRIFNWNEQPVRYCQIFLKKLYGYAHPRLRDWAQQPAGGGGPATRTAIVDGHVLAMETKDKLRRRLANWCRVAVEKITIDYERLEMQRVAHNAMLLLTRIQDFEQRARAARGDGDSEEGLPQADRTAIVVALQILLQVLAPLVPHIAEELWSLAGDGTLVSTAPWPLAAEGSAGAEEMAAEGSAGAEEMAAAVGASAGVTGVADAGTALANPGGLAGGAEV
jgi:leucyl-tRNA synthetase